MAALIQVSRGHFQPGGAATQQVHKYESAIPVKAKPIWTGDLVSSPVELAHCIHAESLTCPLWAFLWFLSCP